MDFQKYIFDVKPQNLIVEIESVNEVDALDYLHLCKFDDMNTSLRCPNSEVTKILSVKKKEQTELNDSPYKSSIKTDNYEYMARPVNLRKRGRGYEWTEEETNALVNICKQRRFDELKLPGEKRIFKWQSVVDAMATEGFDRSVVEVKAKWKREVKKSESRQESHFDANEFEFDQTGMFELLPVKTFHTESKDGHQLPITTSQLVNTPNLYESEQVSSPMEILFSVHPNEEKCRKRGKGSQWSEAATESLINICKFRLTESPKSPMIKGVSKWRDVSLAMAHQGHEKTVDEVKAKWDREKKKFLADDMGVYPYSKQMREILLKLETQESSINESTSNTSLGISESKSVIENLRDKYKKTKTMFMSDEAKRTRLFSEYLKLERQKFELKKEALEETKRFHDSLITIGESLLNSFKQNSDTKSTS